MNDILIGSVLIAIVLIFVFRPGARATGSDTAAGDNWESGNDWDSGNDFDGGDD